jgi:tetratricopeptide (TPR) repeat protein
MADFATKMETQLETQITENPYSVANDLQLLRFYNLAYIFDTSRLAKAVELASKAVVLSPHRPQLYFEVATTHYYSGSYLQSIKKEADAKKEFSLVLDWFYTGVLQYQASNIKNGGYDQLAGLMTALKGTPNSQLISKVFVESKSINDIADGFSAWANYSVIGEEAEAIASRKNQVKDILSWLIASDPKNTKLKSALESIK